MRAIAVVSLLLALLLVTLSAYLRLDHSGIGCEPWPACYGNIGVAREVEGVGQVYERLLEETREPLSWATPAHRLVASVLGLLIVAMFLMSLGMRRDRMIALLLTSLTIFLAMLGIRSGGLHDPAIVVGNLLGGFAMLGLLGWMVFRKTDDRARRAWRVGPWPWAVLVVLCAQIALGALTSANFAASACRTLPDCHGSWLPGSDVTAAFDLTRQHRVGETGMVIGGPERADIQKLHRIMALLVTAVALIAGTRAMRARGDVVTAGILLVVLVGMELLAGIAAIATELPIALALAHNSLAALSLLAAVKLLADSRRSSGGSLLVSTS